MTLAKGYPFLKNKPLFNPFFINKKFRGILPNPMQATKPLFYKGFMAERQGFEPWERLRAQRFSRPPRSTTPAPLRGEAGL